MGLSFPQDEERKYRHSNNNSACFTLYFFVLRLWCGRMWLTLRLCSSGAGAVSDDRGAVWLHGPDGHQAERRARGHPHRLRGHRGGVHRPRGPGMHYPFTV